MLVDNVLHCIDFVAAMHRVYHHVLSSRTLGRLDHHIGQVLAIRVLLML